MSATRLFIASIWATLAQVFFWVHILYCLSYSSGLRVVLDDHPHFYLSMMRCIDLSSHRSAEEKGEGRCQRGITNNRVHQPDNLLSTLQFGLDGRYAQLLRSKVHNTGHDVLAGHESHANSAHVDDKVLGPLSPRYWLLYLASEQFLLLSPLMLELPSLVIPQRSSIWVEFGDVGSRWLGADGREEVCVESKCKVGLEYECSCKLAKLSF